MGSIVTERFISCHNRLKRESMIKSSRQFAISLDFLPQSLNEILKGKRDVTVELLRKAISRYNLSAEYLFMGVGDHFKSDEEIQATDHQIKNTIFHVPIEAQAGYGGQLHNPVFFQDLPSFSLPDRRFQHGTYRCFDVNGDSMEPSLHTGDRVVCSELEQHHWSNSLRDNLVYVVITEGDVVVKRIQNKIATEKKIVLISDNDYYQPKELDILEVKEIWRVEMKISHFLPTPGKVKGSFQTDIGEMKESLNRQSNLIKELGATMEILLKQNRSSRV